MPKEDYPQILSLLKEKGDSHTAKCSVPVLGYIVAVICLILFILSTIFHILAIENIEEGTNKIGDNSMYKNEKIYVLDNAKSAYNWSLFPSIVITGLSVMYILSPY